MKKEDTWSLIDGWKFAKGEIGLGMFMPPETTDEEEQILSELCHRYEQNIRLDVRGKLVISEDGRIRNISDVTASCPTCRKRLRLSLAEHPKYCSHCGQKLCWDNLQKTIDFVRNNYESPAPL